MFRVIRKICVTSFCCLIASLVFVALPGCPKTPAPAKNKDDKKEKADHLDYGPHGGPCAEWGEEDFHAEFIVNADKKQVIVYVLGSDPKAGPKNTDASKIKDVEVAIISVKPPKKVDLKHDAKLSGDKGIAYTAEDELFAKPDGMEVEISGKVNDKPYSGKVKYKASKSTASLFLTPGGIYTAADIKANANANPDFPGIKALHAQKLKLGDRICPVTSKKAQADFAWIVDGQRYEFCCPPCVENFIEWAHDHPEKIKKSSEYVYKDNL